MRVHESITLDVLMDAVERRENELDNPGFCITCGEEHYSCEPDAREYECEHCGEHSVYGAEEILLNMM